MSVVISGMHRSGTSAVARSVEALGLVLGSGSRMPATEANARGYFERVDVAQFNESALALFGGAWDAPPSAADLNIDAISEPEVQSMRFTLDLFSPDIRDWYVKDPRLSLLLPLWDRLCLRRLPVVAVIRDPAEVTSSLKLRSGISERRGLALWLRYYQGLAAASAHRDVLVLDFERMTEDPRAAVDALHGFLSATGSTVRPVHEVQPTALLETELRRQTGIRLSPEVSYLLEPAQAVHRSWTQRHGVMVSDGLPPVDLPPGATEALEELTEVFRLRQRLAATEAGWEERAQAAGWAGADPGVETSSGFADSVREHTRQLTAQFERDQLEDDLVQTLSRLHDVQQELAGIRASRTYKVSYRIATPLRRRHR